VLKKRTDEEAKSRYQTQGAAKANIFCFMEAYSMAACADIGIPGDRSCETILTPSSIMPVGVGGEAEDAGEVEFDRQGDGVSGVVGGVM
jgi:hypothetical protein